MGQFLGDALHAPYVFTQFGLDLNSIRLGSSPAGGGRMTGTVDSLMTLSTVVATTDTCTTVVQSFNNAKLRAVGADPARQGGRRGRPAD